MSVVTGPSDLDPILADLYREKKTRVREVTFSPPRKGEERYAAGVTMRIEVNAQNSTSFDLNVFELREWAARMLAYADEIDPPAEPERFPCCAHCAPGSAHAHLIACLVCGQG